MNEKNSIFLTDFWLQLGPIIEVICYVVQLLKQEIALLNKSNVSGNKCVDIEYEVKDGAVSFLHVERRLFSENFSAR